MNIPKFSGAALDWMEFIVTFRDVVHNQPYLNDRQRNQHLCQNLEGEAKAAVKDYANDPRGYVLSLKKIEYLFGQRSTVVRAILGRLMKGKPVENNDVKGMSKFYYDVSSCLITLRQLNYAADLNSADTLAQAVRRFPSYLKTKWAERSMSIRNREEPSLVHLGEWLKQRVLVMKEVNSTDETRKKGTDSGHINTLIKKGATVQECQACEGQHALWKCNKYKALTSSKKWEFVKGLQLCMNCFKQGHRRDSCSSKNVCLKEGCGKKHHASLHDFFVERDESFKAAKAKKKAEKEKEKENPEVDGGDANEGAENGGAVMLCSGDQDDSEVQTVNAIKSRPSKVVFLHIVPVTINIAGKKETTYALLDNGAQFTLMREEFFKKFGVKGKQAKMSQGTIKDKGEDVNGVKVSLAVSGRDGGKPIDIEEVFVQPAGKFNMPSRPRFTDWNEGDVYTHLDGLSFDAVAPEEISLLIGGNSAECHVNTEVRRGRKGQPLAFKTPFGWSLFGSSRGNCGCDVQCMTTYSCDSVQSAVPSLWEEDGKAPTVFLNLLRTRSDVELHEIVESFWRQEHCGILPQKEVAMSREDVNALERMEKETVMVEGHYQIPMLWKDVNMQLPNNMPMAKKRFEFLLKKFRADGKLFEQFKAVIDGYLQKEPPYARKMEPAEVNRTSKKTWTLPTFPVFHPNKPDKPRVVNDAAAEYHGISLNKELLTRPDLLNLLVGVLMRFRTGEIAIAADIEAMFHQVRVSKEDSDALRFLWKADITNDDPPDVYQMDVHIFGAKDSPTVANFAVKKTARDNHQQFGALAFRHGFRGGDPMFKHHHF